MKVFILEVYRNVSCNETDCSYHDKISQPKSLDFHEMTFTKPVTVTVSEKVSPGYREHQHWSACTCFKFQTFTIRSSTIWLQNTPHNFPLTQAPNVLDSFMIIDLWSWVSMQGHTATETPCFENQWHFGGIHHGLLSAEHWCARIYMKNSCKLKDDTCLKKIKAF